MRTISKNTVMIKKLRPIPESHTLLLSCKLQSKMLQQHMLRTMQVFHTLMLVVLITQELQPWTQMVQFGKELTSMMVKLTDTRKETTMRMISKNTAKTKKSRPIPDFHTLPPFSKPKMHQLLFSSATLVFHILQVLIITQELHQWTQMV
jgi:hypothetical protein